MRVGGRALIGVAVALVGVAGLFAQGAQPAPVAFEGARILDGSGGAPIENAVLLIQDARVSAVGTRGSVTLPPGVVRVDVTGKTIMPAMINVHAHMGYEAYTSWGAHNHTAENLLDHLRREAYYGVGVATSVGSSPTPMSLQFQRDQAAAFDPSRSSLILTRRASPCSMPRESSSTSGAASKSAVMPNASSLA